MRQLRFYLNTITSVKKVFICALCKSNETRDSRADNVKVASLL